MCFLFPIILRPEKTCWCDSSSLSPFLVTQNWLMCEDCAHDTYASLGKRVRSGQSFWTSAYLFNFDHVACTRKQICRQCGRPKFTFLDLFKVLTVLGKTKLIEPNYDMAKITHFFFMLQLITDIEVPDKYSGDQKSFRIQIWWFFF